MKKCLYPIKAALCARALCMVFSAGSVYARDAENMVPGIYELCAAENSSFVLDERWCTENQDSNDGSLQIFHALDVNQQKYYVEQLERGAYRIISLASGKALTVKDSTDHESESSPVRLTVLDEAQKTDPQEDQIWYAEHMAGDIYYLKSSAGSYLTRNDSVTYNGETVSASAYTGRKNQRWVFHRAWISGEAHADTDFINPYDAFGKSEDLNITFAFGEETETLPADVLSSWINPDAHSPQLDEEALRSYVEKLADKYNTVGQPRNFKTHYGKVITLYKGDFGWKMDVKATMEAVKEKLGERGETKVTPVWSQTGGVQGEFNDIGDSYVEVDLNNQKVWLYQNGEEILETDCVSGTYGTDRQTPGGVYDINGMRSPATLTGPGYSSPVSYWMPFNGGIGLHDATWRSEFGGDIFRTNGSHGCINLPLADAEIIYHTVSIGYPVVCYS